jgi:transcriptional regulator with XRE-family HTH domain
LEGGDEMSSIGEIIKSERVKLKMSQLQLSDKSYISNSYLCDIEKGRTIPSIPTLVKISSALGIKDINYLLNLDYVSNEVQKV